MRWLRILLAIIVALLAQSLAAQVTVSVRLSKQDYLAGEPIVLFIDVTNVGTDTVAYGSGCDFDVKMSVVGTEPKSWVQKDGCFTGHGEGFACWGVDHPPGL